MSLDPVGRFERLFNPRGVAVVGATEDSTRPGGEALNALKQFGYAGAIYPVNPKYPELAGLKCYKSLGDIDGAVDMAIIAVPAELAVTMVKNCGTSRIPFAVVLSGGFKEAGSRGTELQQQMLNAARAHNVRILGPNCVGIVNFHAKMFAAFGILTRPPLHKPGPVSMVMQSGGFGNGLAYCCRAAGIGFRIIAASGNEADLSAPEIVEALIDDPETKIILAYLEGVNDGRALMAAGRRALAAGKALLVWKAGNTKHGAHMAATHTANMTGQYDVWRVALRQAGIVEVREFEEAVDYIKVLLNDRMPKGPNVAVVSPSGGSAVVFSDAADLCGLHMPVPGPDTLSKLSRALPHSSSVKNPIDLGAGGILSKKNNTLDAINALLADDDIHQLCLMTPVVVGKRAAAQATMLAEAARLSAKPILVFSSSTREIAQDAFEIFEKAGISVLPSPTRVARAARMLVDLARSKRTPMFDTDPGHPTQDSTRNSTVSTDAWKKSGALDELESKNIVRNSGIAVTSDTIVRPNSPDALARLKIKFPVAVKILSRDVPHKTDAGGVILNVNDAAELETAIQTVTSNVKKVHPSARIDGVLVSEMVVDAIEMITGVLNDPVFGPVILLGFGGIFAEVMRDSTYRVAPFGRDTAYSMIDELKARPMLDGPRGRPPADVEALAQTLTTLSQFAWRERDALAEVDVNPLMVRPRGQGVVAADALVVLSEKRNENSSMSH